MPASCTLCPPAANVSSNAASALPLASGIKPAAAAASLNAVAPPQLSFTPTGTLPVKTVSAGFVIAPLTPAPASAGPSPRTSTVAEFPWRTVKPAVIRPFSAVVRADR